MSASAMMATVCNCRGGPDCCMKRAGLRYEFVPSVWPSPLCTCPQVWHGVTPPPCPIHNPVRFDPTLTVTTADSTSAPKTVKVAIDSDRVARSQHPDWPEAMRPSEV